MALINRITRLFTADLHAVLDRLEEPEVLLKQAVREMEDALDSAEQRLRRLQQDQEELERARRAICESMAKLDDELDLCFAQNEEALARSIVRRKLEAERAATAIATRMDELERTLAAQHALVEAQRRDLDAVRQKVELAGQMSGSVHVDSSHGVGSDEVEVAFLREKQRRAPR